MEFSPFQTSLILPVMVNPSKSFLSRLSLLMEGFIPEAFTQVVPPVPLEEQAESPLSLECKNPEDRLDPFTIRNSVEHFSFGPLRPKYNKGFLRVIAWNLERNMAFEGQVALLKTHPALRDADIYLFSELDRGCTRSGYRHGPREMAKALGLNGSFAIKYVELPRPASRVEHAIEQAGEHGVAMFCRLPILEVGEIRHTYTEDMSQREDQPRLGGATTLWADLQWGQTVLRVYSLHFDAGLGSDPYRSAQAKDLVDHASSTEGPVLFGGDTNAMHYTTQVWTGLPVDPVTQHFRKGGFLDAHESLPASQRGTTRPLAGVRPIIDHFWLKGLRSLGQAEIIRPEQYLSDHYPIAITMALPGGEG